MDAKGPVRSDERTIARVLCKTEANKLHMAQLAVRWKGPRSQEAHSAGERKSRYREEAEPKCFPLAVSVSLAAALARRSPHKLSQTTFHRTNSFIYSYNY